MAGHAVLPSELCLIRPPYAVPEPVDPAWRPCNLPLSGYALVWRPRAATRADVLAHMLARPPGLPLFLVLPPPGRVHEIVSILGRLHDLAPRAVLPDGPLVGMASFRALLAARARPIATEVSEYLLRRGLLSANSLPAVKQVLDLAASTQSITALCRRMYLSRRTLGRHFEAEGIPVPSHWLQMGRLLHVAARLQREHATVFRAAVGVGYPDGFTMSNQMKRLLGVRPRQVRECLGWEWIVESWVREETARNGFSRERFADALAPYLEEDCEPVSA